MNFRAFALSALTLAVLAPATVVSPAAAKSDAHTCNFRPMSDRDGTWCNPFSTAKPASSKTHGLKVSNDGVRSLQYYINNDTRGSSMQR
jgi:hypothetical protein